MTVPPPVIAANRSLLTSLIATNLLGQNTGAIGATAGPAVLTGAAGTAFSEMALAGMAGRAMGGTVGLGRREPAGAVRPSPLGTPVGPITSIAAELQKLAELRDCAVVTDDEFITLKQRLLAR